MNLIQTRYRLLRTLAWVFAVYLVLAGCVSNTVNQIPLPKLPQGAIELRVAYVINPRLPRMDAQQLQILFATTQATVQQNFGVTVKFLPVEEVPISKLFQMIPADRYKDALDNVYDFKTGKGDMKRLSRGIAKGLQQFGEPLPELEAFVRPYIGELKEHSFDALGEALARFQVARIERWKSVKALDGGPAIDATPYNEITMWMALGYGNVPFDVILTNQPLVSAEYDNASAHTAIRGGYSNGVTTYSKLSRYGTMSIWSTFALTTDDAWVTEMRAGEVYSPEEAAMLSGVGQTHEIGHQLFHFGHPLNQSACIMNPMPMFSYRAWVKKLSPKNCPVGSSPAMQPGAVDLRY